MNGRYEVTNDIFDVIYGKNVYLESSFKELPRSKQAS